MEDVVQKIVKPETQDRLCRYVEIIPEVSVGRTEYFVSHVWKNKFHDTVALIAEKCKELRDTTGLNVDFVWIDIFAVNQHKGGGMVEDLASLKVVVNDSWYGILAVSSGFRKSLRNNAMNVIPKAGLACAWGIWAPGDLPLRIPDPGRARLWPDGALPNALGDRAESTSVCRQRQASKAGANTACAWGMQCSRRHQHPVGPSRF
jgi:hypothetical protein